MNAQRQLRSNTRHTHEGARWGEEGGRGKPLLFKSTGLPIPIPRAVSKSCTMEEEGQVGRGTTRSFSPAAQQSQSAPAKFARSRLCIGGKGECRVPSISKPNLEFHFSFLEYRQCNQRRIKDDNVARPFGRIQFRRENSPGLGQQHVKRRQPRTRTRLHTTREGKRRALSWGVHGGEATPRTSQIPGKAMALRPVQTGGGVGGVGYR